MKLRELIWPVIGLGAVGFSIWLLVDELRGISLDDVGAGLAAISTRQWFMSAFAAVVAYAALAGYDRIALMHIGKHVNWVFVTLCSFSTYALSHNLGGSVISGAVIRYRAYGTKGLSAQEVGVLVALCLFTFVLSTLMLGGIVLLLDPSLIARVAPDIPVETGIIIGCGLLFVVAIYAFGSWLRFKPFKLWKFELHYPRLPIVARQLVIGPIEIIAAISIIYFALPPESNPGFIVVAGVFLAAFSAAQISHAPGGLGVLEVVFIKGMPEVDEVQLLSALLVFRMFYLLIPLLISIVVVIAFERSQMARRWARPLPGTESATTQE